MNEEQIKQLRKMVWNCKYTQGQTQENAKFELIAFLDGVLSGIELPNE